MKAVSLSPLHATFAAWGYTSILTPSYDANHRGWVALHASHAMAAETFPLLDVYPTMDILGQITARAKAYDWTPWPLPEGHEAGLIVGVAYLAKTENAFKAYTNWNRREDTWCLMDPDYTDVPCWQPSYGEYDRSKRAWWLCHPRPLRNPILVKGFGGMWATEDADARDKTKPFEDYEIRIIADLKSQGITLPNEFDPAFWRTINRRGETDETRPKNL